MKKVLSFLLVIVSVLLLVGCGEDLKQVAIIQYVSAPALDSANQGIVEGLRKNGYVVGENIEIVQYNPQAASDKLSQMVAKAVREADLIFCIATPVAQACVNELNKQNKSTPMFFTAVTDPVASGIISNATTPGVNISGTSDLNPVAEQVAALKSIDETYNKLGFIYTSNESNSIIQLNLARQKCIELGIELVERAITNNSDITLAVTNLANDCDAIYVPTDNVVSSSMATVSNICNTKGVVTICGEINMLKDGGILSVNSVDYFSLGIQTGVMGAKALNGDDVSRMAVEYSNNQEVVINKALVSQFSLSIKSTYLNNATDYANK